MGNEKDIPTINRELSWLAFNERVLQEARDASVPLLERLRFLAIFSSNLDEFFRVRVASLRSLLRLKKKSVAKLGFNPSRLLREIHRVVTAQQEAFGEILRGQLLPGLAAEGIHLIDERRLTPAQGAVLEQFFDEHVRPHLAPVLLDAAGDPKAETPFLEDKQLYLVVELWPPSTEPVHLAAQPPRYALVAIPSPPVQRFVTLPGDDDQQYVVFLDDVIRHNLPRLFADNEVGTACAVKLSRDADLYIDDEFSGDLVKKIEKSLAKRETGLPSRFLYDLQAPYSMVAFMKTCFGLEEEDLVLGGRYHNLSDLMAFPDFGRDDLNFEPLPPLPHPGFEAAPSIREALVEKDQLLSTPYQSYQYVVRFLEEAADDPAVERIWITLYRVAADSAVVRALIRAARQGKQVTAFVEVKARFDEARNLHWANQMEAAGVRTLFSMPGIKVHTKLALVERREGKHLRRYAYLGTGNFNEKTARVYADHALFTADARLADDVRSVFAYLADEEAEPTFEHLLVAPFHMRQAFYGLLDEEVARAEAGEEARVVAKMNSLEDEEMIARLYATARAGVDVRLIVRGISCLVPEAAAPGTLHARSLVDRFLEHARLFVFHRGGEERMYLASADWMHRNLSTRVEVAFPLYDEDVRRELRHVLALQLADDTKARLLDGEQRNHYVRADTKDTVRAQTDTYSYFAQQAALVDASADA